MISKPMLPPKKGYVEVEIDGARAYRNVDTGVLMVDEVLVVPEEPIEETSVWDELDAAYQEGVNGAYDQ